MASIQTTILLQDRMSNSMEQIIRSVNTANQAFEAMRENIEKGIEIPQINDFGLTQVISEYGQLQNQIDQTIKKQEELETTMRRTINSVIQNAGQLIQGIQSGEQQTQEDKSGDSDDSDKEDIGFYSILTEKAADISGLDSIIGRANDYQKALNSIQSQTGATVEEMNAIEQSMRNLYKNGMGEDYADIADSMSTVKQVTGQMGKQLEDTTHNAILMKDVFGYEIADSIKAADTLTKQFGLNSKQAYNLIAQGSQMGMDKGGELLDIITEYSEQFQSKGFNAEEMFQILLTNTENGNWSADEIGGSIEGIEANGTLELENFNNKIQLSKDALQELNNIKYDDIGSALTELERTINDSLAGTMTTVLTKAKEYIQDFTQGINGNVGETTTIFGMLGFLVNQVAMGISQVAGFISDNWSLISPAIYAVIAALGIYMGLQLASNILTAISTGLKIVSCLASYAYAAATGTAVSATQAETASQYGLNAALLACPLTWIIVGILAVVAAIYIAVTAFNKFTGSSISAAGAVIGAFYGLGAAVYNCVALIWNHIASVAEFVKNVFNHPIYSVKKLFFNLADNVFDFAIAVTKSIDNVATNIANAFIKGANMAIKAVNFIIEAINKLPAVQIDTVDSLDEIDSITSELEDRKKALKDWLGEEPEDYKVVKRLKMKDIGESFLKGYDKGKNINSDTDKTDSFFNIDDFTRQMEDMQPELPEAQASESQFPETENQNPVINQGDNTEIAAQTERNTEETAYNTRETANSVSTVSTDLKLLRDIAEREIINRFTTAQIKVDMVNNNTVSKDLDLDGISRKLRRKIEGEMYAAAEGVHY